MAFEPPPTQATIGVRVAAEPLAGLGLQLPPDDGLQVAHEARVRSAVRRRVPIM